MRELSWQDSVIYARVMINYLVSIMTGSTLLALSFCQRYVAHTHTGSHGIWTGYSEDDNLRERVRWVNWRRPYIRICCTFTRTLYHTRRRWVSLCTYCLRQRSLIMSLSAISNLLLIKIKQLFQHYTLGSNSTFLNEPGVFVIFGGHSKYTLSIHLPS